MSGGSYDYFYRRVEELKWYVSTLKDMAHRCREGATEPNERHWRTGELLDLGALVLAADHFDELARDLQTISDRATRAEEILRAVEWWRSGDSGRDAVIAAYKEMIASLTAALARGANATSAGGTPP